MTTGINGATPSNTIERRHHTMIAEPVCVAERGRMYCGQPQNFEARTDRKTNAITTVSKDNYIAEPCCLRYERNEEAKMLRKQYEAGEIHHGYHEYHELQLREDNKSNTISTVLKDNPIAEPIV